MNREDLRHHLQGMRPGEVFILPYAIYEGIFGPGELDQAVRDECEQLALECGCAVDNSAFDQQVRFTKNP